MNLLTVNAGSSSIKFGVFESGEVPFRIVSGKIERIGLSDAIFTVSYHGHQIVKLESFSRCMEIFSYISAIKVFVDWLEKEFSQLRIGAISNRIVHGGHLYNSPQVITQEIKDELKRLYPFDPEHLPNEILLIETLQKCFPMLKQIACFDTAFHHNLPRVAKLLPIPRRYEKKGVRRYGFHGLSYAFLMRELFRISDKKTAEGRIILAHLGNGASLAAVLKGQSVDTTMGFTPSSGILMSSRSGDIDPGLVGYLIQSEHLSLKQFSHLVNFESGLLGVSETSSDIRDLLIKQTSDYRAAESIALFCYQVKKQIGAYAAALEGVDAIVFSGGIGENSPEIRAKICDGLEFLGINIDVIQNQQNALIISNSTAHVRVFVIPTDEEQMMAIMMCDVLNSSIGQDS